MPGGLHPPLDVILSWPKPSHESAAARHGIVIFSCVLTVLAILVVMARLRARYLRRNFDYDDLLLLVAMVPTIGLTLTICIGIELEGIGRHAWDLDLTTLIETRKVVFAFELLYLWASSLIKLSILCFHTRLGRDTLTPRFLVVVRSSIIFIVIYMITFTVTLFFTCRPFNSFWNQIWQYMEPDAANKFSCSSEGASLLVNTGVSIVADFIATSLPFFLFWDMNLPRRQKTALGSIFALGFLLCIVGIIRFWYIYKVFFVSYDVTYVAESLFAWTAAEVLFGIICASAPALKIFFHTLNHPTSLPTALPTSANSNTPNNLNAVSPLSKTSPTTTTATTTTTPPITPTTPTLFPRSLPRSRSRSRSRHRRSQHSLGHHSSSLFRKSHQSFVRLDDEEAAGELCGYSHGDVGMGEKVPKLPDVHQFELGNNNNSNVGDWVRIGGGLGGRGYAYGHDDDEKYGEARVALRVAEYNEKQAIGCAVTRDAALLPPKGMGITTKPLPPLPIRPTPLSLVSTPDSMMPLPDSPTLGPGVFEDSYP